MSSESGKSENTQGTSGCRPCRERDNCEKRGVIRNTLLSADTPWVDLGKALFCNVVVHPPEKKKRVRVDFQDRLNAISCS